MVRILPVATIAFFLRRNPAKVAIKVMGSGILGWWEAVGADGAGGRDRVGGGEEGFDFLIEREGDQVTVLAVSCLFGTKLS